MGTFNLEYAPQRGDIIYGKQRARTAYKSYMTGEQLDFVNTDWAYFDNYNENFGISTIGNYQTGSPDNLMKNIETAPQGKPGMSELPGAMIKSRLSPVSVFDPQRTPPERLKREKTDTVNLRGVSSPRPTGEALASARYMLALRRACKFGIAFVATNDAFVSRGATIRFLLDGLDMRKVATKEPLDRKAEVTNDRGSLGKETIDSIYVPITTSELRYVFRYWEKLRKVVAFYVAGQSVEPPWETDYALTDCFSQKFTACLDAWSEYRKRRESKETRHSTLL